MDFFGHLQTLLACAPPAHCRALLSTPCDAGLELPETSTLTLLGRLAAGRGMEDLFCLHLLGRPETQAGMGFAAESVEGQLLMRVFPELETGRWHNCRLQFFPLPVLQGERAGLVWCLAGVVSGRGLPPMLSRRLDARGDRALAGALPLYRAMLQGALLFAPLLAADQQPVTGRSFQFGLWCALHLLQYGRSWPQGVLCSGALDGSGGLTAVGGVRRKIALGRDVDAFLLPRDNYETSMPAHVFGCSSTAEAAELLDLLLTGAQAAAIRGSLSRLGSTADILAHLDVLPLPVLRAGRVNQALARLREEPRLYLGGAVQSLGRLSYEPDRYKLLAGCFTEAHILKLAEASPELLDPRIRWCDGLILCCNHCGDVAGMERWSVVRSWLLSDEGDADLLDHLNYRFNAQRLNRYHFSPELPEELSAALNQRAGRHAGGQIPDRVLGGMYGTLCQNAGFCGREQDGQFENYCRLAVQCFGRRYVRENRRILAYRIYHLLDRDALEDAARQLNEYLGLPGSGKVADWIDVCLQAGRSGRQEQPFEFTLAVRVAADCRSSLNSRTLDRLQAESGRCAAAWRGHPYQLTFLNLGRIFQRHGRVDQAVGLYKRMIDISLSGGPTLRVMALLGALQLHRLGGATARDDSVSSAIEAFYQVFEKNLLYMPHFAELLCQPDARQLLECLARGRRQFFPFSYR